MNESSKKLKQRIKELISSQTYVHKCIIKKNMKK